MDTALSGGVKQAAITAALMLNQWWYGVLTSKAQQFPEPPAQDDLPLGMYL
jgi:hypothetical protein